MKKLFVEIADTPLKREYGLMDRHSLADNQGMLFKFDRPSRLAFWMKKEGIDFPLTTVVTQVIVNDEDPDFKDPSKPVGPFYTMQEALQLKNEKNYFVKEVKPGTERGWRRVVPSPEPIDIVEKESINALLKNGIIVIASGEAVFLSNGTVTVALLE